MLKIILALAFTASLAACGGIEDAANDVDGPVVGRDATAEEISALQSSI